MKAHIFFIILLLPFVSLSQPRTISLASDIWPPFTDVEGQKAIALELVTEALNRSGIKVEFDIVDFPQVMTGISEKTYDGSAALWHNAEREKAMYFSVPYLQNRLILVGRKGVDVSATSIDDLAGKTVAVVNNYDYGLSEEVSIVFKYGRNDQENLQKLLNKEADYMLVDALLVQYLLTYQREEALEHLEIGKTALLKRSLHFALRRDVANAEYIINRFNKELTGMVADGTYNRILSLNWIQMDVDGDGQDEMVLRGQQAGAQPPTMPYSVIVNNPNEQTPASNRYFIEGQIYDDWNNVPNQYKAPPVPPSNNIPVFRFKLN